MDFSGVKEATFDEKGRVVLPADFKNQMGGNVPEGQLTIQIDPFEKCLNIYTLPEWEIQLAKIKGKLNRDNREQSRMLDWIYQRFKIIPVPESCRLNIPNDFMEKVGITKEVIFTGAGERIRLWDLAEHKSYVGSFESFPDKYEQFVGSE